MITESLHYPDGQPVMVGDILRILSLWKVLNIIDNVATIGEGEPNGTSTYTTEVDQIYFGEERITLVRRAE